MAFSRLVFTVLVLCVSCYATTNVPAFLWGDISKSSIEYKSNPLKIVKNNEFNDILNAELATEPYLVIFVENTLSVEDFSRRNSEGESSFPYLHSNLGNSIYFPSVEEPFAVVSKLADLDSVDRVTLTDKGLSEEIESRTGKVLLIDLKDAEEGESRADLLRRHNDFMQNMFSKLQKQYKNVVAVYTAYYPSWVISESHSRVRRQALEASNRDYVADGLRLYSAVIRITDGTTVTVLNGNPVLSSDINGTVMNTTMTFGDHSLVLNFRSRGGYWFFDSVNVNSSAGVPPLVPNEEIYALLDFSYRCGLNVTFSSYNATTSVTFQDLKVQPYFRSTNESVQFGDSFNCVGFFSAPIWSGIFVVFLLLTITFYGIMMMMDIRTMDRFDDPKGKTITINTSE